MKSWAIPAGETASDCSNPSNKMLGEHVPPKAKEEGEPCQPKGARRRCCGTLTSVKYAVGHSTRAEKHASCSDVWCVPEKRSVRESWCGYLHSGQFSHKYFKAKKPKTQTLHPLRNTVWPQDNSLFLTEAHSWVITPNFEVHLHFGNFFFFLLTHLLLGN